MDHKITSIAIMEESMDSQYIEVYTVNGSLNAEIVKTFLEAAGIQVYTSQESIGLTYGLTVGSLGLAHIYVPADQEEKARELLAEMERGDFNQPGDATDENQDDIYPDEE
jgi:hypothetical protein